MLENEPEGGERTGAEPAGTTADSATTASGSAASATSAGAGGATTEGTVEGVAETKPPARKRASRRKAAPLNQPEQTDAPVEASTTVTGSGESPQAEVLAPVAPKVIRLAQGTLTAQGAIVDPLDADRDGAAIGGR